jgi:hypothetical protein
MPPNAGRVNQGVSGNPLMKDAQVGCTDAVCGEVTAVEGVPGGGKRRAVTVNCGPDAMIVVVTTWTVEVGQLVAVAPAGSLVGEVVVRSAIYHCHCYCHSHCKCYHYCHFYCHSHCTHAHTSTCTGD